jgi:pimeloyl-ACP methyl ester carboxylesterase
VGCFFNAVTFLDEHRDPEWLALDLPSLATFSRPVLLTHGDHSDPTFSLILDQLARVLPRAEKRPLLGVGHGPHVSHPGDYAQTIESFIRQCEAERADKTSRSHHGPYREPA